MKHLLSLSLLFVCLFASPTQAGGDTVPGQITAFSQNYGNYIFRFKPDAPQSGMFSPCAEITVHLTYKRVPWYSWIPMIHSPHPSKETTLQAVELLRDAHKHKATTHFGSMVNGLKPTKKACVFRSKGLGVFEHGPHKAVVSFYDPL